MTCTLLILLPIALLVWPFGEDESKEDRTAQDKPPGTPEPQSPVVKADVQAQQEPTGMDDFVDFAERGIELIMLGKPDRAVESFKRALQRNPDDGSVLYNLALALEDTDRMGEACDIYAEAVDASPEAADIRTNYGIALLNAGAVAGAVEQLARAAALTPDDPAAHYNLGCAYQKAGDLYEAVASFRQALRLDPQDIQCRYNLAVCLNELGHKELTIRELRVFIAQAAEAYPQQVESAKEMLTALNA